MAEKTIKKIVLTGGPCAGKTTALVKIIEHFTSRGYKVFTIPEVPTLFIQAGMDYLTPNKNLFYEGEKATLEIQLALEDKFMKMAQQCDEPAVIICDRGAMDISAYMDPATWEQITRSVGTSTDELREHRYDAVLHLVSAADGAEKFYTTTNTPKRYEGIEQARILDKRVIDAWTGHPHLRVINNHENFDNKLKRVIKEISNVLGLPQPIEHEKKYIVEVVGEIRNPIDSDIVQTYLVADPGVEARLRQRENVYDSLLQQADPYRQTVHKHRRSFIWKGQYFELDEFLSPQPGLMILETKGVEDTETVNFPPFIKVVEDITGKTEFYNYNIALKK